MKDFEDVIEDIVENSGSDDSVYVALASRRSELVKEYGLEKVKQMYADLHILYEDSDCQLLSNYLLAFKKNLEKKYNKTISKLESDFHKDGIVVFNKKQNNGVVTKTLGKNQNLEQSQCPYQLTEWGVSGDVLGHRLYSSIKDLYEKESLKRFTQESLEDATIRWELT